MPSSLQLQYQARRRPAWLELCLAFGPSASAGVWCSMRPKARRQNAS
jgi:hypothetical protein